MIEEKKLDEKTLEGVSGGEATNESNAQAYLAFMDGNCKSCRRLINCPYGYPVKVFQKVGANGQCPGKEPK